MFKVYVEWLKIYGVAWMWKIVPSYVLAAGGVNFLGTKDDYLWIV